MDKTKINAEKIGIVATDHATVTVKKLQTACNIFFKPVYVVCPKSNKCNQNDIEKLFLILSLVFSIFALVLGFFANIVVNEHALKSIALGSPALLLWVLGLGCIIYLHYLKNIRNINE